MGALIQMGEGVCLAVASTLQAYLPAVLTDIAAIYATSDTSEFGFAVPLPMVNNVFVREVALIPDPPAITVTSVGGDETDNGAPAWGQLAHHLDVSVFCMTDTLEISEAQVNRYLQAIWTVLKLHQGLDGSLSGQTGVDTPRYGKSPVLGDNKNQIIGWVGSWEVIVHVMESVAP